MNQPQFTRYAQIQGVNPPLRPINAAWTRQIQRQHDRQDKTPPTLPAPARTVQDPNRRNPPANVLQQGTWIQYCDGIWVVKQPGTLDRIILAQSDDPNVFQVLDVFLNHNNSQADPYMVALNDLRLRWMNADITRFGVYLQ